MLFTKYSKYNHLQMQIIADAKLNFQLQLQVMGSLL